MNKQEEMEKLQNLKIEDLSTFAGGLMNKFGSGVFKNCHIPLSVGVESELQKALDDVQPENALVIKCNRGVSTALVAIKAEKVTAVDAVDAAIFDDIMDFIGVSDKVNRIICQNEDFDVYVNSGEYDFIYFERGAYIVAPEGYAEITSGIFVKVKEEDISAESIEDEPEETTDKSDSNDEDTEVEEDGIPDEIDEPKEYDEEVAPTPAKKAAKKRLRKKKGN